MWRSLYGPTSYLSFLALFFLMPIAARAQQGAAQNPIKDGLPLNDIRLDRKVDVEGVGIPIAQLLQKMSSNGLQLVADKSCAEQKLQLRLHHCPLRSLMHALAVLLPAHWEPLENHSGYQLILNAEAVTAERRWWDIFLDVRRTAEQTIQAAFLTAMQTTTPHPGPQPPPGFKFLFSPKETQQFLNALPLDLQQRIAQTFQIENIVDLYTLHSSGILMNTILGGTESEPDSVVIPLASLPLAAQNIVRIHQEQNGISLPDNAVLVCHADLTGIAIVIPGPNGAGSSGIFQREVSIPPATDHSLWLGQAGLPDEVKQLGGAAPADLKELARYQESRFWPNPKPSDPTALRPQPFNRADVLNWLGQRADIEFISDYYDKGGIPFHPKAPVKQPIDDSINDIAWGLDFSWKKEGDIYLFRNNRWYRDDRLQVPDALAQQLLAQQKDLLPPDANDPKATVEWLGRVGQLLANLSPWQIANGFRWLTKERLSANINTDPVHPLANFSLQTMLNRYPFCQLADVVLGERVLAQFVAALAPEQKQQLVQGVLPFDSLSPALRQVATYLSPGVTAAVILKQQPLLLGIAHRPFGAGYTLAASVGIASR
jgi:hypothetical protein